MDDSDFKSKARTAIDTFGDLNKASEKVSQKTYSESTKGLKDMGSQADKVDLARIAEAAETMASRFSAAGIMVTTALANIANRAVDTGISMVKALTVDGMVSGFGEYELKMKSIQTIMSNTLGKNTLEDVNGVLDELNVYADQTIYNFAEMTRNIGTFTAAGVDLETSATSIKGIANLAAASGSNSQQASTAMYQLSQAIAAGSVKLQDWNSVVNAGMGGKLFQNALIETADSMGIANTASENFRSSLEEGWITTEVLTKTLDRFSKDQSMLDAATKVRTFTQLIDTAKEALGSGWVETFELLIGDFETATDFFTELSEILGGAIDSSSKSRNELVKSFTELGGRDSLINSIMNIIKAVGGVFSTISAGIKEIFPPKTAQQWVDMAEKMEKFTEKLILNKEQSEKLKTIVKGVASVFSILFEIIKPLGPVIKDLIPDGLGSGLVDTLVFISEELIFFQQRIKDIGLAAASLEAYETILGKLETAFENLWESIKKVEINGKSVGERFEEISTQVSTFKTNVSGVVTKISEFSTEVADLFTKFRNGEEDTDSFFGKFSNFFSNMGQYLRDAWPDLLETIKELLPDIWTEIQDYFKQFGMDDIFQLGVAGLIGLVISKIFKTENKLDGALDGVSDAAGAIQEGAEQAGGVLEGVKDSLNAFAEGVKAKLLLAIAAALLALVLALKLLVTVDSAEIAKSLAAVSLSLGALMGSLFVLGKIGTGDLKTTKVIAVFSAIVISLTIMAAVIKKLSKIDSEKLTESMRVLLLMIAALVGSIIILTKFSGQASTSSMAMLSFAASIYILTQSVEQLSEMDVEELKKGLLSLAAIILLVTAFSVINKNNKSSAGLILMATSIVILVQAVKQLGDLSWDDLKKGLLGLVTVLGSLAIFVKLVSGSKLFSISVSLNLVASALILMLVPIKQLADMDMDKMLQGLIGLVAILLSLGLFTQMVSGEKLLLVSVAMVILAEAIKLMVDPLIELSTLNFESMMIGMIAFIGILASLALFSEAVDGAKLLLAATAMVILAAAITTLVPPLMELSTLNFEQLGIGLLGLAGTLAIMVLALNLAGGTMLAAISIMVMAAAIMMLVPALTTLGQMNLEEIGLALLALGGAFAILVVVAKVLGITGSASLLMFAAALAIIGTAVLLVGVGVIAFAAGLATLATVGSAAALVISEALTLVMETLMSLTESIVEFVVTLVVKMALALAKMAPVLFLAAGMLIIGLLEAMVTVLPRAVEVIVELVVVLLGALGDAVPILVAALIEFLIKIINGLADAIRNSAPEIVNAIMNLLEALIELILQALIAVLDVLFGWIPKVSDALADLGEKGTSALRDAFDIEGVAEDETGAFVDVISGSEDDSRAAGGRLGNAARSGVDEADFATTGDNKATDFLSSILGAQGAGTEAGAGLGGSILDGIGGEDYSGTGGMSVQAMMEQWTNSNSEGTEVGSGLGGSIIEGYEGVDYSGTGEMSVQDMLAQWTNSNEEGMDIGETLGISLTDGFDLNDYLKTGQDAGAEVNAGIETNEPIVLASGKVIGQKFSDGVNGKKSTAKTAGTDVGKAVDEGFKTGSSGAYSSGASYGAGVATGISSKKEAVSIAASGLGTAATKSFNRVAQIASPSKVAFKAGGFYGLGIANGVESMGDAVGDASAGLANKALDEANRYASMFADAIYDDLDREPTITPVLDLSNVSPIEIGSTARISGISNPNSYVSKVGIATGNLQDRARPTSGQIIQNDNSVHVDNARLLEGATFLVREEADIEKIAVELDKITLRNLKGAGYAVQR